MKKNGFLLLPALLMAASLSAWAGHGKGYREYKEEYWDGNCKVERKFEKNGEYKEERKCQGAPHVHYHAPAPIHVPAPLPPITEPTVTIHGTVRIGN